MAPSIHDIHCISGNIEFNPVLINVIEEISARSLFILMQVRQLNPQHNLACSSLISYCPFKILQVLS